MDVRVLDLDGGLTAQQMLLRRTQASVVPLAEWGQAIRLASSHGAFRRFERALAAGTGSEADDNPMLTFVGSGDFHHVSLALVRRQPRPFNLLVLDNHPDWMRAIPFLHCGTWLYHASQLGPVQRIYHVGGDVDFDNSFRWLAPWPALRSGRIIVSPARRTYNGWGWRNVPHRTMRRVSSGRADAEAVEEWLAPYRDELAAYPLYISLDKDVMPVEDAVVNWDSGHLAWSEVEAVLQGFLQAANGKLAGMDVVGDWSAVRICGLGRKLLHWTEHPPLHVVPDEASRQNEEGNLRLLQSLAQYAIPALQGA